VAALGSGKKPRNGSFINNDLYGIKLSPLGIRETGGSVKLCEADSAKNTEMVAFTSNDLYGKK
jgi:hypothetical protein